MNKPLTVSRPQCISLRPRVTRTHTNFVLVSLCLIEREKSSFFVDKCSNFGPRRYFCRGDWRFCRDSSWGGHWRLRTFSQLNTFVCEDSCAVNSVAFNDKYKECYVIMNETTVKYFYNLIWILLCYSVASQKLQHSKWQSNQHIPKRARIIIAYIAKTLPSYADLCSSARQMARFGVDYE